MHTLESKVSITQKSTLHRFLMEMHYETLSRKDKQTIELYLPVLGIDISPPITMGLTVLPGQWHLFPLQLV